MTPSRHGPTPPMLAAKLAGAQLFLRRKFFLRYLQRSLEEKRPARRGHSLLTGRPPETALSPRSAATEIDDAPGQRHAPGRSPPGGATITAGDRRGRGSYAPGLRPNFPPRQEVADGASPRLAIAAVTRGGRQDDTPASLFSTESPVHQRVLKPGRERMVRVCALRSASASLLAWGIA